MTHSFFFRSAFLRQSLVMALLFPVIALADSASTQADLLFNWAEATFPAILTSTQRSQTLSNDYYYRGPYPQASGGSFYLGVTLAADPHVVMLDTANNTGVIVLGLVSDWISQVTYADLTTNGQVTTCTAVSTLDHGEQTLFEQSISTAATDTSAICTQQAAELTLVNPHLTTGGHSSALEHSRWFGLNAASLAISGSNITMLGGTLTTTGSGATAAFATGTSSSMSLQDLSLSATGLSGHGVAATLGGALVLMNVTAHTTGANSSKK